jgi:hypothetical protein
MRAELKCPVKEFTGLLRHQKMEGKLRVKNRRCLQFPETNREFPWA